MISIHKHTKSILSIYRDVRKDVTNNFEEESEGQKPKQEAQTVNRSKGGQCRILLVTSSGRHWSFVRTTYLRPDEGGASSGRPGQKFVFFYSQPIVRTKLCVVRTKPALTAFKI